MIFEMTKPMTLGAKRYVMVAFVVSLVVILVMINLFGRNPRASLQAETFLVHSNACRIPDLDPRHETVVTYLKPSEPIRCSRRDPMTYTVAVGDGRHLLRIDLKVVEQYTLESQPIACCYMVVDQRIYKQKICLQFDQEVKLEEQVEFVFVKCSLDDVTQPVIYYNTHVVVRTLSDEKEKSVRSESEVERANILLVGIDSMSRLNLMRSMPRTVSQLKAKGWLELRGYNKVGDNTRPNLLAILTGLDEAQLEQLGCWPSDRAFLDHCHFIWADFRDRGYVTAYAEDTALWSTFTFSGARGFKVKPTDYFLYPFFDVLYDQLPTQYWTRNIVCAGPTSVTDHTLKYTLDMFSAVTDKPLFALTWLNNFSHNTHNIPVGTDEIMLQFLQDLSETDAYNNTIVVFLSDHGNRFGDIRKTYVGWLEERLPFFYMKIPNWFQEKYPQAYRNLQDNDNKLTSPYDLHMTLKELVDGTVGRSTEGCRGCPKCGSLFSPVETDRYCEDAGIPQHWCTCTKQFLMSSEDHVIQKAAGFLVSYINTKVQATHYECLVLELQSVEEARQKDDDVADYDDYVIVFVTSPGTMVFDATVRHRPDHVAYGSEFELLGMISRIDSYEDTSRCVLDKDMKLYCYCK